MSLPVAMQFLAASVAAVNSIRVIDGRDFFQPELLPALGPPYNIAFQEGPTTRADASFVLP